MRLVPIEEDDAPLTAVQARTLTDIVKGDAEALWRKLVRLHQGGAHTALGYTSWGDYFAAEFGQSRRRGYELLRAAEVSEILASAEFRTEQLPANEAQANELTPFLREPNAETLITRAWQTVVDGPEPITAATIKAVRKNLAPVDRDDPRQPKVLTTRTTGPSDDPYLADIAEVKRGVAKELLWLRGRFVDKQVTTYSELVDAVTTVRGNLNLILDELEGWDEPIEGEVVSD
jgi:hypothetical protein